MSNLKFSITDIVIDENYIYLSTINNNKKDCLIATIFIIAGVSLIIDGFDLGLSFGGGGSGHPSF